LSVNQLREHPERMVEQRINSEVQIKVLSETHENPLSVSPSEGNQ